MRRIFTLLLTVLTTLSVSAQFSDGFYRLQCKETGRYLTVHNDYVNKESAKQTGQVDIQSLETIDGFDNIVNDPGSVLYLKKTSKGWVIQAQNFTTEGHNFYLQFTEVNDAYRVWTEITYDGTKYLRYLRDYTPDSGQSYITTDENKSTNWNWYITPVSDADDQYLGLKGDVQAGGKYYTAFFASFPIQLGSGMKAYAVNTLTTETTTLEEIGNTVPKNEPVIIECAGEAASDNKVTPLASSASYSGDNYLSGKYYCYPVLTPSGKERRDNPAWNAVDYNPEIMRLLGSADDKLVFLTATDVKYVPANRAFLYVSEGSAETLPTDGTTGIKGVRGAKMQQQEAAKGRYTLQGVRLPDNIEPQKGIYIEDGKLVLKK